MRRTSFDLDTLRRKKTSFKLYTLRRKKVPSLALGEIGRYLRQTSFDLDLLRGKKKASHYCETFSLSLTLEVNF